MIYQLNFCDANGQVIGQATFNVPSPDDFVGCLLQAIRSGWVEGTASLTFTAIPV
jgi:hypothetical protein